MTTRLSPEGHLLMAVLRQWQKDQGMEFCDKCGDALYEEALRCDFCCGTHGVPSQKETQAWIKAHPGYTERFGPGREEEYANET